jgi:hypothetical protein
VSGGGPLTSIHLEDQEGTEAARRRRLAVLVNPVSIGARQMTGCVAKITWSMAPSADP